MIAWKNAVRWTIAQRFMPAAGRCFWNDRLTGWGFHQMPAELPRYVSGYHEQVLYPHNTYLELLVEDGVLGLVFYLWLMWEMWRLGRGAIPAAEEKRIPRSAVSPDLADPAGGVLGELGAGGDELSVREWSAVHDGGNARRSEAEGRVVLTVAYLANSVSIRRRALCGG